MTAAPSRVPLPTVLRELSAVRPIQAVAVSPDGRYLAWSADTGAHQRITIAPVAHPSATVTIATCARCDDSDFAWSPNGSSIAFVETAADGQGQLAVARADGSGAHPITRTLRGPINSPKWSPAGTSLAVLYTPGAPKAPSPLLPRTPDAGVVGSTYFEQRIAIVPVSGGAERVRLVSPADLNIYEYDWSPDGRRFVASAAHGDGDAQWWVAALYTLDARGGAATKIATPSTQIASPRFSADGRWIAYIGGLMSDESITGGDVYTVAAGGGIPVDLTAGRTASVVSIAWNGSSRTMLLTELAGGSMRIVRFDTKTKAASVLWSAEESIFANSLYGFLPGDVGVSVSRDGRVSALIRQSFARAPEIYAGPIGAWRPVTAINAAAPHVVPRARSITWKSDDFTVQGWLLYPPGYTASRRYPLVTVVHGGPAFAVYPAYPSSPLSYDAVLASQGYVVFEPNARGSYGQGEAFTRGNVKDFGGGDLRDILAGIKAAERVASVDDARVGIFGWSYGGYMTMWALTQTTRFRAAVSGAGLSDWLSYYGTNGIDTWMTPFFGASVYDDPAVYAKSSPITFIKNVKTPTLMVGGDRDAEVPITQSYEYAHALKDLGTPSQFVVYPGEGHLFLKPSDQIDVATRLVGWFDRWMPAPR